MGQNFIFIRYVEEHLSWNQVHSQFSMPYIQSCTETWVRNDWFHNNEIDRTKLCLLDRKSSTLRLRFDVVDYQVLQEIIISVVQVSLSGRLAL